MSARYEYVRVGSTYDDHPIYDVFLDGVRLGQVKRCSASTDTKIPGTRLRRQGKGRNEWHPVLDRWPYRLSYLTRGEAAAQLPEPPAAARKSALDVSCETCAAPAGERCRTENGKPTSAHARRCFDSARLVIEVRECIVHGWTTAWDEDAYSPTGYSCQHFCEPENPCDMPVSEESHTLRMDHGGSR